MNCVIRVYHSALSTDSILKHLRTNFEKGNVSDCFETNMHCESEQELTWRRYFRHVIVLLKKYTKTSFKNGNVSDCFERHSKYCFEIQPVLFFRQCFEDVGDAVGKITWRNCICHFNSYFEIQFVCRRVFLRHRKSQEFVKNTDEESCKKTY